MTHAIYLGLSFSTNMTWNKHINIITKKVTSTSAFLRCNTSSCSKKVKAQCYPSLVRTNVEYAATVWDPHTTHLLIGTSPSERHVLSKGAIQHTAAYQDAKRPKLTIITTMTPKHEIDCDVQDSIQPDHNSITSLPDPSYYHQILKTLHEIHHATLHLAICLWNTLPATLVVLPMLEAYYSAS